MTIAATIQAAEEMEEDILRALWRRQEFHRMLAATDRALWPLEELNLEGVTNLPETAHRDLRAAMARLPVTCRVVHTGSVQRALDGVFEAQSRLLARYVPGYEHEVGEESAEEPVTDPEPPLVTPVVPRHRGPRSRRPVDRRARFRERTEAVLRRVRDLPRSSIVGYGKPMLERARWLDEMVQEGLVLEVAQARGRVCSWVGEGDG